MALSDLGIKRGTKELMDAHNDQAGLLWATLLFSVFVNALQLTGPLYMMQIYDRVLNSRSEATLAALTALIVGLFVAMGVLEHVRARVLARG
jgi:ATP-binding cassette subfamily C protein